MFGSLDHRQAIVAKLVTREHAVQVTYDFITPWPLKANVDHPYTEDQKPQYQLYEKSKSHTLEYVDKTAQNNTACLCRLPLCTGRHMSRFGEDIIQILTAFNKCWCASYL
jgi:hypothetical protein